ncbi:MAG: hypothetical protein R3F37_11345 [Candidatus Competibacteraceae bacterium]
MQYYAENPPKKYRDIYPFNFETDDWEALWIELKSIFEYWMEQGVRIFRVDNPHTKPFPMWEWLSPKSKKTTPDAVPGRSIYSPRGYAGWRARLYSILYHFLAQYQMGVDQNMTELTQGWARYFRPNFWPNTPDILPESLQFGGRPGFITRLILAATLSANYGMYGPAFELMVSAPLKHGSEDYLDSGKIRNQTMGQFAGTSRQSAGTDRFGESHSSSQSGFTTESEFLFSSDQ